MRTAIYLLLLFGAVLLIYCNQEASNSTQQSGYLNLQDSVAYVGMETCRSCHGDIHSTFIHTGMGQSFDRATEAKSAATYGEHALVYDEQSDFYYKPFFKNDTLYIQEFRLSGQDTVHQRTEPVQYIVGSGQHTNSHILNINGYIYQAPITYYTQEEKWDMAPGFEEENLRFERLLASECITCHNHLPEQVAGSLNKFAEMPQGIECERCHGPGAIHVEKKLAGEVIDTSRFIDYSIVNPSDLPRAAQMDLCQRCHLQGVAVLNEGKSFYDFKPGMQLNEVLNVFLPRYTNSHEKFIMASQADRLRLSECYQQSDMTCLTCHNPHKSVAVTGKAHFNNKCQSCHNAPEPTCALSAEEQAVESDGCVGCHMPKSGSIDIPHVNITDHYIGKQMITDAPPSGETEAFLGLEILTKKKATPLEMAKGYLALYDKYVTAPMMLDSAAYYVQKSTASAAAKLSTQVHLAFNRNAHAQLVQYAEGFSAKTINDAWTAYRLGEGFFHTQDYPSALQYFQRAVELMPLHLDFQEKLGTTQVLLQQFAAAEQTFRFILQEHPKRKVALTNLGYVLAVRGDLAKAMHYYNQAIALDPDYEQALLNKAAILLAQQQIEEGRGLLERILEINPQHAQAKGALERLQ